jgi:hypothetical protein
MRSRIFELDGEGEIDAARSATNADPQCVVAGEPSGTEELFEQEFEQIIEKLRSMSARGPLGTVWEVSRGRTVRRVLLRKTQQHVYYSIDEANDMVIIRSVWGGRRGRGPKL